MKTNMQQLKKKPYLRRHKGLRPVSLKRPALNIHHDFLSMMATAMFTNIPIIGKNPPKRVSALCLHLYKYNDYSITTSGGIS